MKAGMFKQILHKEVVSRCLRIDFTSGWGTLPQPNTVKPKCVDEILMKATVRNVRVGGIKVKVCRRIGMCEQAFCNVVSSLSPICVIGLETVSGWGTFPHLVL